MLQYQEIFSKSVLAKHFSAKKQTPAVFSYRNFRKCVNSKADVLKICKTP